ncbi:FtsW/RodA/SpoVE family cell cycle protein [Rossellomorea sp. BNER]|uniref:FtsW/RodA/SpoVE family cell cycle protein n=1 Tax=Rossellomorea sp. BNER TaxID=2962031 RepID=UPI003AF21B46
MYGRGYGEAEVAVPEAHSDFIFSVITEEFGFVGACFVLCLYFLLIYKIIVVALKNKGEYENVMAAGIILHASFPCLRKYRNGHWCCSHHRNPTPSH